MQHFHSTQSVQAERLMHGPEILASNTLLGLQSSSTSFLRLYNYSPQS